MIKVEFLGPISREAMQLDATTLADVANELKKDEALNEWLQSCAVAVNDALTDDLSMVLKDGDKVSLLPPVCGG